MAKLRILANEEEGTLQRAIFEFSRRNIDIVRLLYSRESEHVILHITVLDDSDAIRVLKHLKRIGGVVDVECSAKQEEAFVKKGIQMSPQELLG